MSALRTYLERAITAIGRDIYSLRAAWNHIYLGLYVFLALFGALKVKEAFPTIVTVTGGVVSVLFTNYILSKKDESK